MADQWYYQLFGQEFGPVDFSVVAQKYNGGELGIRDMVRQGANGTWVRASSVASLVQGGPSVAVETADVATDIDSFLLVDEKALSQPQVASDIDSFLIVDEKVTRPPEVATSIDNFILGDDKNSKPPTFPRNRQPVSQAQEVEPDFETPIWYFQTLGQELGPVPLSELVAMVERGDLNPADVIRLGADGQWVAAGEIEGLFANRAQTAPSPANRSAVRQAATPAPRSAAVQTAATPQPAVPQRQPAVVPASAPVAADANWYCYINDQEYGPMSLADLQGAAAQGQVTPNVYVKYSAQGEWVLASQVPNLFPTAAVSAPPPIAQQTVTPASSGSHQVNLADAERNELVQQLLAMVKQGLSAELIGGVQPTAPVVGAGWYCNISGSMIGPMSIESLVQMVLQKRLFPDDMIRMGTTGEWFPAKTVPDLFPDSSPQGKAKKVDLDSAESVMERIDRMYREGQEAQAKADAAKAASPAAPAKQAGPRHNPAADALRNMSANIARGATAGGKAAAKPSGDSLGEQFAQLTAGLKFDGKVLGVLATIAVLAAGYFLVPMILSNAATKSAMTKLVAIHARITENEGGTPDSWAAKSKDLIKEIEEINSTVKSGSSGSAQRDVARMGRALRDMVEALAKPKAADATAGSSDEYVRASKSYQDYFKAACKKMGIE